MSEKEIHCISGNLSEGYASVCVGHNEGGGLSGGGICLLLSDVCSGGICGGVLSCVCRLFFVGSQKKGPIYTGYLPGNRNHGGRGSGTGGSCQGEG